MMIETTTTPAGNTTTGNSRVFQSDSNWVLRTSKRTKSEPFCDTTAKRSNCPCRTSSQPWLSCLRKSRRRCSSTLRREWTKRRNQVPTGRSSWQSWTRRMLSWRHGVRARNVRKRLRKGRVLRPRRDCLMLKAHWLGRPRPCVFLWNMSQSRLVRFVSIARRRPRLESCGEGRIDCLFCFGICYCDANLNNSLSVAKLWDSFIHA